MRVRRTRSSASPPHSPLTRGPLDGRIHQAASSRDGQGFAVVLPRERQHT